jgi:hypothetical protein
MRRRIPQPNKGRDAALFCKVFPACEVRRGCRAGEGRAGGVQPQEAALFGDKWRPSGARGIISARRAPNRTNSQAESACDLLPKL